MQSLRMRECYTMKTWRSFAAFFWPPCPPRPSSTQCNLEVYLCLLIKGYVTICIMYNIYIWLYIIMWLLNPRRYWEPSNICVNIAWCKAVWIAPSQNLWRIFCSRFGSQRSRLSNTIRHNVNLIQSVTWIVQEVIDRVHGHHAWKENNLPSCGLWNVTFFGSHGSWRIQFLRSPRYVWFCVNLST